MIRTYDEPTTAGELAHALELFALDQWGRSCSGGCNAEGGSFDIDLGEEEVAIVIVPSDQAVDLRRAAARVMDGERLEWLDADERALIEAHRARRDAGGEAGGATGGIVDRIRPSWS